MLRGDSLSRHRPVWGPEGQNEEGRRVFSALFSAQCTISGVHLNCVAMFQNKNIRSKKKERVAEGGRQAGLALALPLTFELKYQDLKVMALSNRHSLFQQRHTERTAEINITDRRCYYYYYRTEHSAAFSWGTLDLEPFIRTNIREGEGADQAHYKLKHTPQAELHHKHHR